MTAKQIVIAQIAEFRDSEMELINAKSKTLNAVSTAGIPATIVAKIRNVIEAHYKPYFDGLENKIEAAEEILAEIEEAE